MNTPYNISICIFTYNRAAMLAQALQSCLEQNTLDGVELLVVDDGSSDDTEQVVARAFSASKRVASDQLRYVKKIHSGAPDTRNKAIGLARGQWLLWLADDDVLLKDAIELIRSSIVQYSETDVFYTCPIATNEKLEPTGTITPQDYQGKSELLLSALFTSNQIPDCGSVIHRSCYERVGCYDTSFPRAHDYELWSRLASCARFKRIDEPWLLYRLHGDNISGDTHKDRRFEVRVAELMLRRYKPAQLLLKTESDGTLAEQRATLNYVAAINASHRWQRPKEALRFVRRSLRYHRTAQAEQLETVLCRHIGAT
jgi:glycosyltransferase involved in cell wall biosynthesis